MIFSELELGQQVLVDAEPTPVYTVVQIGYEAGNPQTNQCETLLVLQYDVDDPVTGPGVATTEAMAYRLTLVTP